MSDATLTTLDQVRRIVSDVLNAPLDSIVESSSPDTVEGWDSVQHLNIVLALEQELGVQFEPEDIEQMTDVSMMVAKVRERVM